MDRDWGFRMDVLIELERQKLDAWIAKMVLGFARIHLPSLSGFIPGSDLEQSGGCGEQSI